jgi:hypothetical protein
MVKTCKIYRLKKICPRHKNGIVLKIEAMFRRKVYGNPNCSICCVKAVAEIRNVFISLAKK